MSASGKVIVFGGAGFLGSYVVDEFVNRGYDTIVFDLKEPQSESVRWIEGDILDLDSVVRAATDNDYVYNFAGLADLNASVDQPLKTVNLNILGNTHVLEACRIATVSRYVYASSAYVFSEKGGFYGVSKKSAELLTEQYAQQFGMDYTIIRYGSVYGDRADEQNRIYRIIKQALEEKKITFQGDGQEIREYVHGRDCGKLSVDILMEEYSNQSVMLTGVEKYKYQDLLDLLNEMLGGELEIEYLNNDYKGHYVYSPYSFSPTVGKKLVSNPSIDFGQGMLECIDKIYSELCQNGDKC